MNYEIEDVKNVYEMVDEDEYADEEITCIPT